MVLILLAPREVDEPEPVLEVERVPPKDAPPGWADEPSSELGLELDAAGWSVEVGGREVLSGPGLGESWSWMSAVEKEGWELRLGTAEGTGWQAEAALWTVPNAPFVVIDLDARVDGEALADGMDVKTGIRGGVEETYPADGQVQAVRFGGPGVVYAPVGAVGRVDGDDVWWEVWEGLGGLGGCEAAEEAARQVSLRLVVVATDEPVPVPVAFGDDVRAVGTPMFVDPMARSEEPWEDGRARDGEEYARRLRALAFGHSDPGDPRYGNGGLLAAGVGATFVIPSRWWDDPAVEALRSSLQETEIDVAVMVGPEEEAPAAPRVALESSCDLVEGMLSDHAAPLVVMGGTDRPYSASLRRPLPAVVEAGLIPATREEVLDRLFEPLVPGRLFATGEHRVVLVPLVATRNPLVDVAGEEILTPDRGGHWTLHDSLTRRLGAWEFSPRRDTHRGVSLTGVKAAQWESGARVVLPRPDGFPVGVGGVTTL